METRRLTAKKASAKEILSGKFVKKTGFESSYVLTNLGRRLSRVDVMGLVVDKYLSADGKYATITIDDSSDTVRCKAFVNVKIYDGITNGDLVKVIGKIREYNGEVYVMPEIVRKVPSDHETLRIVELQKIIKNQKEMIKKIKELREKTESLDELKTVAKNVMTKEEAEAILEADSILETDVEEKSDKKEENRKKIIGLIEAFDMGEGVEYKKLIEKSGLSEIKVDLVIQDMLESGACFEPKPGKIRKL